MNDNNEPSKRRRTTAGFEGHYFDDHPTAIALPPRSVQRIIELPREDSQDARLAYQERMMSNAPFDDPNVMTYMNRAEPRLPTTAYPLTFENMFQHQHRRDLTADEYEITSTTGSEAEDMQNSIIERRLAIEYAEEHFPNNESPLSERFIRLTLINLNRSLNQEDKKYITALTRFKPRKRFYLINQQGEVYENQTRQFENKRQYLERMREALQQEENMLNRTLHEIGYTVIRGGKTKKKNKNKRKTKRKIKRKNKNKKSKRKK